MGKVEELHKLLTKDGAGASAGNVMSVAHTTFSPTYAEPEYPGDKKRKKDLLKEWVDKAKRIGAPIEEPKTKPMPRAKGVQAVRETTPGEAPGPPPRQGLEWNTATHRWHKAGAGSYRMPEGKEGRGGVAPESGEEIIQEYNDKLLAEFHGGDVLLHALVFSEFLKVHGVDSYAITANEKAAVEMVDEQGTSTYVDPVNDYLEPQQSPNDILETDEAPKRYELKDLPEDDKRMLAESLIDELQDDKIEKARGVPKQAGPPPGPAPRIGLEWDSNTHRWTRPEGMQDTEHVDQTNINDVFKNRGALTPAQKRKIQAQLVATFDSTPFFKSLAHGLAFYTQGFFDRIRDISGAIVTDTIPEFEANTLGSLREDIMEKKENPLIAITFMAKVKDVYGNSSDDGTPEGKALTALRYNEAKQDAEAMITALDMVSPTDAPLYRGVQMKNDDIPDFKPGDRFDIPKISSFSRDEDIARGFAMGTARGVPKGLKERVQGHRTRHGEYMRPYYSAIVIKVEGPNKALDVDVFSTWPQKEALSSGEFEVVNWLPSKGVYEPGVLTLKQKRVAGHDWEKGRGIHYLLPVDVSEGLNQFEYGEIIQIKDQIERHKKWKNPNDKEPASAWYPEIRGELRKDKLDAALKKLGYTIKEGNVYEPN